MLKQESADTASFFFSGLKDWMKFCMLQSQSLEVSPLSGAPQEVQYNLEGNPSDHGAEPTAELPASMNTEATDE